MYQDTRLIHHRKIEWPPIFKEGKVDELVVNGEVVVRRVVVWGHGMALLGSRRPHMGCIALRCGKAVENVWAWCRVGECGEVQSGSTVVSQRWHKFRTNQTNLSPKKHSGSQFGAMLFGWELEHAQATESERGELRG